MSKKIDKIGLMVDCSRNSVMSVNAVKKLIDVMSLMGYSTLQLYTEDTYEVDGEPYFGYLRGRYTREELQEIDRYALGKGIELFPCIQTLAHLKKIFRWAPYWGINDIDDILLVDDPRTDALIENIFSSLAKSFTSRRVNIGMDEAHQLGLGRYMEKHGYTNRVDLMIKQLAKVAQIAKKYGFKCVMWGDMFFRLAFGGNYYVNEIDKIPEDILEKIPDNVELIYWDYYSTDVDRYKNMIKGHQKLCKNTLFAGGGWTWNGLVPHNRYAISASKAAIFACAETGVKEAFITLWGDDGGTCSPFSVLPTLFTVAKLVEGETDEEKIKGDFEKLFKVPFDAFMYVDLPNEIYGNQPLEPVNPSKYLLYNDVFLGMFDSVVDESVSKTYLEHAKKLKEAEIYEDWKFVFRPLRMLCEVLELKADLGLRTRRAYSVGVKVEMQNLIEKCYKPLIVKIKALYDEMKIYWFGLYKPNGFEVIDYRFGGLIQRLNCCIGRLEDYLCGRISEISELEEPIIDYLGREDCKEKKVFSYNGFGSTVTVNSL